MLLAANEIVVYSERLYIDLHESNEQSEQL